MSYSLKFTGFKTQAEAETFAKWYEGQGEQDAAVWFECCKDDGIINTDFMPVDVHTPFEWDDDTLVVKLDISHEDDE
jgi:hypothetical protein